MPISWLYLLIATRDSTHSNGSFKPSNITRYQAGHTWICLSSTTLVCFRTYRKGLAQTVSICFCIVSISSSTLPSLVYYAHFRLCLGSSLTRECQLRTAIGWFKIIFGLILVISNITHSISCTDWSSSKT